MILESGLGLPSVEWAWVQPEVAKFAQVVAYDRAGLGWSEAGPEPRDARRIATELHTALQEAGIDGPYVLVGHSNGGLYVRTFADQYPDEIVGMVLVDSAHPDQYDRSNTKQRSLLISKVLFVTLDVMARLGVLRVIDLTPTFFPGLPPHQEDEMRAFVADGLWAGTLAEFLVLKDRTDPQVRQTGNLEDMPLAVLTASASVNEDAVWGDLQDELTTLSTNSAHFTVEDAEHGSIVLNRGHALVVARAVRQVVDAASTGRPVTPPDQSQ